MTDAEILEHAAIAIDRMFMLAQWFVAISLALVTAVHIAASRINLLILIAMMILYSSYFALIAVSYTWNFHLMDGFFQALSLPAESPITKGLSHPSGPYTPLLFPWLGGGIFISCNAFLIRTYIQERGKKSKPQKPFSGSN